MGKEWGRKGGWPAWWRQTTGTNSSEQRAADGKGERWAGQQDLGVGLKAHGACVPPLLRPSLCALTLLRALGRLSVRLCAVSCRQPCQPLWVMVSHGHCWRVFAPLLHVHVHLYYIS